MKHKKIKVLIETEAELTETPDSFIIKLKPLVGVILSYGDDSTSKTAD